MKIFIYQIYYSNETKNGISPLFLGLDNLSNERTDWFEFYPILKFLQNNELDNDAWYGFFSPKFQEKTGYKAEFVVDVLNKYGHTANVALFSPGWDQLSYFLNPWEQGEIWHQGITAATQKFLDDQAIGVNLNELVTDTTCSTFSNYIVAKKEFWEEWKKLAESFFIYVERADNSLSKKTTSYGSLENQYPLKTFIQERFASLILAKGLYKVLLPDQSLTHPIFSRLFPDDVRTRRLLITCDLLKKSYRKSFNVELLNSYWDLRKEIKFVKP
jgi:hypothetical protein